MKINVGEIILLLIESLKKHPKLNHRQKELKDQSRSMTGTLAHSVPSPSAPSVPAPLAPDMKTPPAMAAAMNVNKASVGDMVLVLGLSKDVADRIVSNRPYRLKGELVAKNVVPKETFDLIKDRISVSP